MWLRHLVDGDAPTLAGIGMKVGRTGPSIGAWLKMREAPTDYRVHAPLARVLGINEAWLIRGEGNPPDERLWTLWLRGRQAQDAERAAGRSEAPTIEDLIRTPGTPRNKTRVKR